MSTLGSGRWEKFKLGTAGLVLQAQLGPITFPQLRAGALGGLHPEPSKHSAVLGACHSSVSPFWDHSTPITTRSPLLRPRMRTGGLSHPRSISSPCHEGSCAGRGW